MKLLAALVLGCGLLAAQTQINWNGTQIKNKPPITYSGGSSSLTGNLLVSGTLTASSFSGPIEAPLTFTAPFSRASNTISLTTCGTDGHILKYRITTGWGCEADQTGGGGGGGGLTSFNSLTATDQSFARVNDTNVTLTIASTTATHTFTLGWTGVLSKARQHLNTVYDDQTYADPAWITSLAGSKVTGNIAGKAATAGNADTVTNGVYTTGLYADPPWLLLLAKAKVGLGNVENTALSTWAGSSAITSIGTLASGSVPWARLTSVPSTFAPTAHATAHAGAGGDPITSLGAVTFTGAVTASYKSSDGSTGATATRACASFKDGLCVGTTLASTVSYGATPTFDLSDGTNLVSITLTGNAAPTFTNQTAGKLKTLRICQDATGGRTWTWPSNVKGAMTVGTDASTCSVQAFISDGTNLYAVGPGVANQ